MLFQGSYRFSGTHSERVRKLASEFDGNTKHKLFSSGHEVYQLAPIIGFMYRRKAERNREGGDDFTIFAEQISNYRDVFQFNYQMIMLLDKEHEADLDARIDKAFRFFGTEKAKPDEELYESYVRGGVDVLYEKLIESSRETDDYIKNLYDFMEEFESRYGQNMDKVQDLLNIARG